MLKSAIIITILAFADFQAKVNAAATLTNENLKDQLSFTILEAKNRAFDQVQSIKVLASVNFDNFIVRTNEMVQKSSNDMKILREEFNEANDTSCNKAQADIDDAALKTIAHYQTCVEKVTYYAEADLNSLAFDGSLLTKEIQYAKNVDEELYRKVTDLDARSFQFGKYLQRLEKCDTQSNLPRLKRQISEALTSYKQCLQNK
ncbi:uncharacterized protein [Linepithema humile]|uniref:uncharacterized protein isoform X2 n=1 Tax=Linepithema humile TaxID=83485 RepID=UPI00351E9B00